MKENQQKEKICYVCGHGIRNSPIYIGQGRYRHERCFPGSQRWLQSEVGKCSSMYEFFAREIFHTEVSD